MTEPRQPAANSRERRDLKLPIELRKNDAGRDVISGHAAVFYKAGDAGTEYALWSDTVERILPGAFDSALSRPDDCRCLMNHDANLILGRSTAGTLKLSIDANGLAYECELPASPAGETVAEAIRRGDITGCSFSFSVLQQTWQEVREPGGLSTYIREIREVELVDVGPVTFPAYSGTDVTVAQRSKDVWQGSRRRPRLEAARRRLRLLAKE